MNYSLRETRISPEWVLVEQLVERMSLELEAKTLPLRFYMLIIAFSLRNLFFLTLEISYFFFFINSCIEAIELYIER